MPQANDTCCFTGHRATKLPWAFNENDPRCIDLKSRISKAVHELYENGCTDFICGMANGCDMYFGEAVMQLKLLHPDVHLEAAIPCLSQAASWPKDLKMRYDAILSACEKSTVISDVYTRSCMMQRNRYMLDNSSILIACYDGESKGGTMNTITLAMRAQKKIILLDI